ncbi:CDP-alcohol phosphatidyltransferase-domain-containing protein [Dunaliella salina]|uniref:CDP-alcohol phosphatidyltransferase-domain-containing protein n=1 Tax=Dunaliella salina TaxID=3046 RepID=A0ABQ7H9T6_DUNSA|nr:CDP-alcohol phosphatidyltransferase-domain-containing protein [Dunaliella salina]|eukprot:KAF5843617.1 CDP-alcohol phosphatidyltransferase-domain-containing protein [Dunaliella salina]
MARNVHPLLFWPNIIGYVRCLLLLGGYVLTFHSPTAALFCFLANLLLDSIDGLSARYFNQASTFGAFFDVILDNATRGILWSLALPYGLGSLFLILEMSVLVATHQVANVSTGADWKGALARGDDAGQQPPSFVSRIMANNFRTPLGCYVIVGLMGLPLWAWGLQFLPSSNILRHPALGAVLLPGRVMAAVVELWVLSKHLGSLLCQDAVAGEARSR